jgi:eukaryotic-like serine/threonine-protein kinase
MAGIPRPPHEGPLASLPTMGRLDDDTLDDPLLRALARTPVVAPFSGTERYRVLSCLGEGGFGVVYEVADRELGRRLALKTLKAHRGGFAASIRRFKREFRAAADLVHPNLVGLHDLASEGSRWFFTMDLVRGCDFFDRVRGPAGLSESRLRDALRQLIAGVAALHRAGIVHRDLKPSNVLVEPDGRVVVLDFGLAGSELPGDADTLVGGTPIYMAPEQAAGLAATAAADWYAVGVMLYEALTGAVPYAPRGPQALMPVGRRPEPVPPSARAAVPADLEELCLALLRREPADRPDAAAILASLGGAPAAAASPARATGRAFVGRARELAMLEAAFASVREGEPVLVRVHGQPGVGKSALLDRFTGQLREQGRALVLAGRCHEREAVPFKAFDGIADALLRYLQALPRSQAAGLLPRDIHLVSQLFPVLDAVPAVRDVPRRQAGMPDPRRVRLRAFAAIKELVARIADKQPLVVAIDDLHWGDIDSRPSCSRSATGPTTRTARTSARPCAPSRRRARATSRSRCPPCHPVTQRSWPAVCSARRARARRRASSPSAARATRCSLRSWPARSSSVRPRARRRP